MSHNKERKHANDRHSVPQEENGVECWCCCSCFADDTPIEVAPRTFMPIDEIFTGGVVLATGPDLSTWKEKQVTDTGGRGPNMDFMFYTVCQLDSNLEQTRIITTADHLFLMASGKLNATQYLVPGDQIRSADGGIATVIFTLWGQYEGGVRHIALGEFDGHDLDGHLINSNGIISADLSVQAFFVTHNLPPDVLVDLREDAPQAGSAKYRALYPSPEAEEFIANRKAWPKGFEPHAPV